MTTAPRSEAEILRRLRDTPELFSQLQTLAGSELTIQQKLRTQFDSALVPAALALHEARKKAAATLPNAELLWLTRVGLEQSTAWKVAQHKASRFPRGEAVLDLCCGIGVDTAALSERGHVTSVDLDDAMTLRCQWNNDAWTRSSAIQPDDGSECIQADVHDLPLRGQLIHVDPDRRGGRDRPAKRLEQYCPNLDWLQNATRTARGGALKLGPASNFIQKFPGCEIELISLNGECREATVWFGDLASDSPYRATVLPQGETLAVDPLAAWCPQTDQLQEYIFDPDPAVVRSGMLDAVGEMHSLHRLDKSDEYLTGAAVPQTGFVRAYRIECQLPNNIKEIRRYFRTKPATNYEVKCRHLHVDAAAVQRRLPRGDGPPRVVFFIRINGKAAAVVAERLP